MNQGLYTLLMVLVGHITKLIIFERKNGRWGYNKHLGGNDIIILSTVNRKAGRQVMFLYC